MSAPKVPESVVAKTAQQVRQEAEAERAAVLGADWPAPLSLERTDELPAFPLDVLPPAARAMVEAVTESLQCPPDLPAVLALGVVAGMSGRSSVQVRSDWAEPLCLFVLGVLDPASRKSSAFGKMVGPVFELESELAKAAQPEVEAQRSARRMLADEQQAAERQATSGKGDAVQARRQAEELARELANTPEPVLPKITAEDATPEALAELLWQQGGRLMVTSAEGGLLRSLTGRYAKSDDIPDVLLKGHQGEPLRVDRRGRDALYVERAHLTLCLTVQPDVLSQLARVPGAVSRGLFGRLLVAWPENTVGHRKIETEPVPERVAREWRSLVRSLWAVAGSNPEGLLLRPSTGALQILTDYRGRLEPELAPLGSLSGDVAFWAGKAAGAAARIAALLHLAANPSEPGERVSEEAMAAAVELVEHYFTPHALRVFDELGGSGATPEALTLLRWVRRNRRERFTQSQAQQANRATFPNADSIEPALELLTERHYLRRLPPLPRENPTAGGRPPSPEFLVNPSVQAPTKRAPQAKPEQWARRVA